MKIETWWTRFRGTTVFDRTQRRLTLQYSGLVVLFLTLFIAIVLGLLYNILILNPKGQLHDLADDEMAYMKDLLMRNGSKNSMMHQKQDEYFTLGQNQYFYYWVDSQGSLQYGDEMQSGSRTQILSSLSEWRPSRGAQEIRYATVQLPSMHGGMHMGKGEAKEEQTVTLMMTGRTLYSGQDVTGTLYIGKDISVQWNLFRWSLIALMTLGLLFFALALILSHIMSKRAMIPIMQSYTRQREFVADASHELRTPLSVMLSSIDTLQLEDGMAQNPFAARVLANMRNEVKRMTKLAGDLLTLARSDSGEVLLANEPLDLRANAEHILQSLQALADAKQIQLTLQAPPSLMMYGDADRLEQLLVILIDNAIKYTPDGGDVRVMISVERAKSMHILQFIVEDNGIGIRAEDHKQIFTRFYREDKSRSKELGGHGLGLAIAKWIVDAHRGTIHVESKVNQGSRFVVRIPMREGSWS
ncbi:sensor histidine kinase [Paenibacillus selenitireducens]|uniref:sensor histidine kinase n=1 Tax=Paenibacillus selenitireducens TaxID=1324314 RepID=UPI001301A771|nr:ATP-binding protein [Paenibacillus selenitireducens]